MKASTSLDILVRESPGYHTIPIVKYKYFVKHELLCLIFKWWGEEEKQKMLDMSGPPNHPTLGADAGLKIWLARLRDVVPLLHFSGLEDLAWWVGGTRWSRGDTMEVLVDCLDHNQTLLRSFFSFSLKSPCLPPASLFLLILEYWKVKRHEWGCAGIV